MRSALTHDLLKFGKGLNNTKLRQLEEKLGRKVFTFSLPAGYTCPGASKCRSRFDRALGRIVDGDKQEFRCFAASMEAVFTGFRQSNDHNFELLKGKNSDQIAELILRSLVAHNIGANSIVRVHVSGDFFSKEYFLGWMKAAFARPDISFYSYTKSVHFVFAEQRAIPPNYSITISEGGNFDSLINSTMKTSKVVFSVEEASILGLQIDHDDSHAAIGVDNFALLLHGQQRKGTKAAEALKLIQQQ